MDKDGWRWINIDKDGWRWIKMDKDVGVDDNDEDFFTAHFAL